MRYTIGHTEVFALYPQRKGEILKAFIKLMGLIASHRSDLSGLNKDTGNIKSHSCIL